MSNVIRSLQVSIQNPIETNYKVILDKLIKAKSEIEHYERKLKEQEEEFKKQLDQQEDFKKEAEKIIKEAQTQADKIIEKAKKEAESLKDEIFKRAYEDGYNTGLNKAQDLIQQKLNEIENLKISVLSERENLLKQAEKELLELIPDIVKKILEKEVENRDFILSYIKNAVNQLSIKNKLTIRVSEHEFDYVNRNLNEMLKTIEGIDSIEIKVDKGLKEGDVLIETPYGFVETGILSRIEKLEEIIFTLIGG